MCWCTYFSRLKCNHAPCSGKKKSIQPVQPEIINLLVRCMCMWWGNPQDHVWLNISANMNNILVFFPVFLPTLLFFYEKEDFFPLLSRTNCTCQGMVQERSETSGFLPDKPIKLMIAKILKWTKLKTPLWGFKTFAEKHWAAKCQSSAERLRFLQHFFWLLWTETSSRFRITMLGD